MDHKLIQDAIDRYNQARKEQVDAYTKLMEEQQTQLLASIKALTEGEKLPEPQQNDDVVTMSKQQHDELCKQLEVVSQFIADNPQLQLK